MKLPFSLAFKGVVHAGFILELTFIWNRFNTEREVTSLRLFLLETSEDCTSNNTPAYQRRPLHWKQTKFNLRHAILVISDTLEFYIF